MFRKRLGLEGACNWNDLLTRAQTYINYESKLLSKEVEEIQWAGNLGND